MSIDGPKAVLLSRRKIKGVSSKAEIYEFFLKDKFEIKEECGKINSNGYNN